MPYTVETDGRRSSNSFCAYVVIDGNIFAELFGPDKEQDARRVAACLNALSNISTARIERLVMQDEAG